MNERTRRGRGGGGNRAHSGNKREREGGTLLYLRRGNKSGRGYFETSLSRRNVVTPLSRFSKRRDRSEAPPDGARRDAAIFNYGRNGPRLCCKYVHLLNRIENWCEPMCCVCTLWPYDETRTANEAGNETVLISVNRKFLKILSFPSIFCTNESFAFLLRIGARGIFNNSLAGKRLRSIFYLQNTLTFVKY